MTHKAWSYTTPPFPSTLALVDVALPGDLQPDEILVKVASAALNPVDVQLANAGIFKVAALAYPKGIGFDFSGTVVRKGVTARHEVGEEIFGLNMEMLGKPINGTLAEMIVVNTATAVTLPKPSATSFAKAAAIPLAFLTAATALSSPNTVLPSSIARPTIVVLGGSSGVGHMAVQYAVRKLNARVIATCSSKNADFVKSLGASQTLDYSAVSVAESLATLKPPEGYLSILDCVGGRDLLDHPLYPSLLTPRTASFPQGGGYISIVGDGTDRRRMGGALTNLWRPAQVLRALRGWWGPWWGGAPRYACINLRSDQKLFEGVLTLLEGGCEVAIDSEWSFDDVPKAFEKLVEGRARGKIVVNVS